MCNPFLYPSLFPGHGWQQLVLRAPMGFSCGGVPVWLVVLLSTVGQVKHVPASPSRIVTLRDPIFNSAFRVELNYFYLESKDNQPYRLNISVFSVLSVWPYLSRIGWLYFCHFCYISGTFYNSKDLRISGTISRPGWTFLCFGFPHGADFQFSAFSLRYALSDRWFCVPYSFVQFV